MRNRYRAYCVDCHTMVPAGHGEIGRYPGESWQDANGYRHSYSGGCGVSCKTPEQRQAEHQARQAALDAERAYNAKLDDWLRLAFAADAAGIDRPPLPVRETVEAPAHHS